MDPIQPIENNQSIERGLDAIARAILATSPVGSPYSSTSGSATPVGVGDYTVATADLSLFPVGAVILLLATIQWNKATGSPAETFKTVYNGANVSAITSTFTYLAGAQFDGRSLIGVITKVTGVNSATAVLNIDAAVTGSSASGRIVAIRIA